MKKLTKKEWMAEFVELALIDGTAKTRKEAIEICEYAWEQKYKKDNE